MSSPPCQLAYLTADLPGIGGVIKQRPEDFIVTEIPLYEPCGEGEHLYLFIEKTNMTTLQMVSRISRVLNVSEKAINFAGMKDKHAITRQMFSIHLPGTASQDAQRVALLEEGIGGAGGSGVGASGGGGGGGGGMVLWADRHHNKLRRGHLLGNRFDLRIRGVEPTAVIRAKRILDVLVQQGVPNYFGSQRFGYLGENHLVGRALIKRDFRGALDQLLGLADHHDHQPTHEARLAYDAGDYQRALACWPRTLRYEHRALSALAKGQSISKAIYSIHKFQRQFFASAAQSYLFNQVLEQRVRDETFNELLPGDLAIKHENRSVFSVNQMEVQRENALDGRINTGEISPSGPMWGSDLLLPHGQAQKLERDVLEAFDIPMDLIQTCPLTQGSRRSLRVMIQNPDICGGMDEHGSYVRVQFELGKGSFATILLNELIKSPPGTPRELTESLPAALIQKKAAGSRRIPAGGRGGVLVSVRNMTEADAAWRGGADIIDIKEPALGSLGQADNHVISQIISQINGRCPVSAALGELHQNPEIPAVFEQLSWLKVGLSEQRDGAWQDKLATLYANHRQQAVAVAYADYERACSPPVDAVLQWAIDFGAPVFLIDTFIKDGSHLLDHVSAAQLSQWISHAQSHDIAIALAGSLRDEILAQVVQLQPDIIAVRGAVCANHDRTACVDERRVRELKKVVG